MIQTPMYGSSSYLIPGGDAGTRTTLETMRTLAHIQSAHPVVRQTAVGIVRGVAGTSAALQARLIRDWVESRVLFLPDPLGTELLHEPSALIVHIYKEGVAHVDCDDVALLAATLGRSIGLRTRYVAVGFSPQSPYQHVWAELASPSGAPRWLPVDPTRPMQGLAGLQVARTQIMEV